MSRADRLAGDAVDKLAPFLAGDEEFEKKFGKWARPEHLPRYPLERWAKLLGYGAPLNVQQDRVIEAEAFLACFPKFERSIVARIVEFVYDEMASEKRAGDKTLNLFRLQLIRRLENVGF